MLPSINQEHGIDGRGEKPHVYITREYQAAMKQMRQDVQIQVAAAHWYTRQTDRYLILAELPFLLLPGETPTTIKRQRDTDNPWKPMQDVLAYKHRAIYNDAQVEQPHPWRRWTHDPRQMLARITIACVHQDDFQLFPVTDFFDQWASQWYNVHRVNKE
jgi:Holliday junction resolvase RusA-like endonuclease